jgi:DNA-directed RNA polymerase subunit E'/Rpb7
MIVSKTEGKCIVEGFIRPDSVRILTYSSGKVSTGMVEFQTTFECMVCYPVDGMLVECICKTITKAGIHAEVIDKQGNVPITVYSLLATMIFKIINSSMLLKTPNCASVLLVLVLN